jgi:DNA polymerase V
VARNVERLVEELDFHAVTTGALSVYLLHKDGAEGFHRAVLPTHTARFDLLLEAARDGLRRAWRPGRAASRMHLTASRLRRPGFVERGLFDPPEEQAREVARVKREVNARLGRFTLRSGATLALNDVYRDEAQSYDICDVRGKICF